MTKQKIIFICGTGRSGTNLIGKVISTHKEIDGRIEKPETFDLITQIATEQNKEAIGENKKLLISRFNEIKKQTNNHILEKSHPALWLVEFLLNSIDESYFICIKRDALPTISSMLKHNGVLYWFKKLPNDKENKFLGINRHNVDDYKNYSVEQKCYRRWLSHQNEITRLENKYKDKVLSVKYEDFILDSDKILEKISDYLQIDNIFEIPCLDWSPLTKWENELSSDQIDNIKEIGI